MTQVVRAGPPILRSYVEDVTATQEQLGVRSAGGLKIATRAGRRLMATRSARMGRNCRYEVRYTFAARRLPKRLRPRNRTLVLRIAVRFQGNSELRGDLSPTKRVKVRR